MTSSADNSTTARRAHDAQATREALLGAARELFDELGYDRATTREIGERARVDPALIARYFGGKEGLFLAAIAERPREERDFDFAPASLLSSLLRRWDEHGHSPISRALASPALQDGFGRRIAAIIERQVIDPLAAEIEAGGAERPRLRAEILVALALGLAVTRGNGTLEGLGAEPRESLLRELAPLVEALVAPTDRTP